MSLIDNFPRTKSNGKLFANLQCLHVVLGNVLRLSFGRDGACGGILILVRSTIMFFSLFFVAVFGLLLLVKSLSVSLASFFFLFCLLLLVRLF